MYDQWICDSQIVSDQMVHVLVLAEYKVDTPLFDFNCFHKQLPIHSANAEYPCITRTPKVFLGSHIVCLIRLTVLASSGCANWQTSCNTDWAPCYM